MRRLSFSNWHAGPIAIAALLVGLCATRASGESTWFLPLDGTAHAISGDGSVVVGRAAGRSGGLTAVSWKLPSGIRAEVALPPDFFYEESYATGVSADGNVIIGQLYHRFVSTYLYAPFFWEPDAGMKQLPKLSPHRDDDGWAGNISGDGMTIIGFSSVEDKSYLVEWRDGEIRGTFPVAGGTTYTTSISFDGSMIVGVADGIASFWDAERDLISLGTLPGDTNSRASDVASDGTRIIGNSSSGFGETYRGRPFAWTKDAGLVELSSFPATRWTSALSMSADGRFIVGAAGFNAEPPWHREAMILGPNGHWRLLEDVLTSAGLGDQFEGWDLDRAHSISADGKTIVGDGIHPAGYEASWVVHVPEPGSGLMLLIGIVFALPACRRTSTSMGNRWAATH